MQARTNPNHALRLPAPRGRCGRRTWAVGNCGSRLQKLRLGLARGFSWTLPSAGSSKFPKEVQRFKPLEKGPR